MLCGVGGLLGGGDGVTLLEGPRTDAPEQDDGQPR